MKTKLGLRSVLGIMILALVLLCGCSRRSDTDSGSTSSGMTESGGKGASGDKGSSGGKGASGDKGESSEGASAIEFLDAEDWRDNSLDEYSAVDWGDLQVRKVSDELGGGGVFFLGETRASLFSMHTLDREDLDKNWEELTYLTERGGTENVRLSDRFKAVMAVGGVLGNDHYVMLTKSGETGNMHYCCVELDENLQVVRELVLDFLDAENLEIPENLLMDAAGNIHVVAGLFDADTGERKDFGRRYYIADKQGKMLWNYVVSADSIVQLEGFYNGWAGIWQMVFNSGGTGFERELFQIDLETGEKVSLARKGTSFTEKLYDCTLWDERTLLYATNQGIFLCDRSWENARTLYAWENHGIFPSSVNLQIRQNGGIGLLYGDSGSQAHYLALEPTTEEVEIQEITFAVPSYFKERYEKMVANFNRKYPTYHVKLKSDYAQTALLTQLTAGDGPVLLDTQLTGFENLIKVLQPLDGFFDAIGGTDDFYEKAMECGKIDGRLYGIVDGFYLQTVVTLDEQLDPKDWDYEGFLDYVEKHPSAKAVFQTNYGNSSTSTLIMSFMMHNLEDNYLIDAETGETYFRTERFERLLEIAEKLCVDKEKIDPVDALKNGESLCTTVNINKPSQVAAWRTVLGDGMRYIGYPGKEGAETFIVGSSPVVIRKTATDSEKKIAYTFLREMLSYECQNIYEGIYSNNANNMSVRKDVLEARIADIAVIKEADAYPLGMVPIWETQDIEKDRETLLRLIEEAVPRKDFPSELDAILWGEISDYVGGEIPREAMIDHLENRVGLYLKENN